jgi:hypothetical protein
MDRLRNEIDSNFDAFQRQVGGFLPDHAGEFALMREGNVVEFFATIGEADAAGRARYPDGVYSLQEVVTEPIDLGFFSHAGH